MAFSTSREGKARPCRSAMRCWVCSAAGKIIISYLGSAAKYLNSPRRWLRTDETYLIGRDSADPACGKKMYELDLRGAFQPCFLWFCKPVIEAHTALPSALEWPDGSQPSWAPALCSTPEHLRAESYVACSARGVCSGQTCLVRVNPGGIFHANNMSKTEQPGGTVPLSTRMDTWPCSACAAVRGEGTITALSCTGAGSLQLT